MKLIIPLFLIFMGCAAIQQAKVDATACLQDPVCRAEAVKEAEMAKGIAKDISGISPIPLSSNMVGGVVYGVFFIIGLIKHGRKKEVPNE